MIAFLERARNFSSETWKLLIGHRDGFEIKNKFHEGSPPVVRQGYSTSFRFVSANQWSDQNGNHTIELGAKFSSKLRLKKILFPIFLAKIHRISENEYLLFPKTAQFGAERRRGSEISLHFRKEREISLQKPIKYL